MKKFQVYLLIAVVAIFSLASGTAAQTVQGNISGTITDPSGAAVPDATVTITNNGTNSSQTAVTASDGTVMANASGMMNVKPYRSHPG
jgi:hypothetical protein